MSAANNPTPQSHGAHGPKQPHLMTGVATCRRCGLTWVQTFSSKINDHQLECPACGAMWSRVRRAKPAARPRGN